MASGSSSDKSRRPTGKSLPAIIGGVALALIAGYFGINGNNHSGAGGSNSTNAAATTTAKNTAKNSPTSKSASGSTCSLKSLPKEATDTVKEILQGGPFEYPQDDNKHFGNYQNVLPHENSSYYREFTVDTPGVNHRGERRIITGGGSLKDPEVWYYTDDHYESFCQIPDAEK